MVQSYAIHGKKETIQYKYPPIVTYLPYNFPYPHFQKILLAISLQTITTTQFEKMGSSLQGKDAVKELMSIKSTAKEVENALRNAFNADLGTYNITKLRDSIDHIGLDKVYNKLGQIKTIGPQAFQGLSTSLLTTNLQMKQSNKLLDSMARSFKNTVQ